MKKKYISPTIDFEFLEEDDILAASGKGEYFVGEDMGNDGYETNQETGGIGTVEDKDVDDGWELL